MSKRTKKVGNTGWIRAPHGIRICRRVLDLEPSRLRRAPCSKCSTVTFARKASGIFACFRCDTTVASGAYLSTPAPPVTRTERSAAASQAVGG
jgi:ribosomal protein L37AE/L43A